MTANTQSPPQPSGKEEGDMIAMLKGVLGDLLDSRLKGIEAQVAELKAKSEYPVPKDATKLEVQHDPTKQEVDNMPAAESASKPAKDHTPLAGAFVGKDFEAAVAAEVRKQVKAVTPVPGSAAGSALQPGPAMFAKMREAIAFDRAACGQTTNGVAADIFGVRSGRGDDSARRKTALFVRKQLDGEI